MQIDRDRLLQRRPVMRAAGHWRDETLLDHLARAVALTLDKTALVARRSETREETRLTYRDLDRLSDLVGLSLRERGVGRETPSPSSCRTGGSSPSSTSPA